MLNLHSILAELKTPDSCLSGNERRTVAALYRKLSTTPQGQGPLFSMWKKELSFLYGGADRALSQNAKIRPEALGQAFGLFDVPTVDTLVLLQSVQTYYSLLMKFMAYRLLLSARGGQQQPFSLLFLEQLLSGAAFRKLGVANFCCADWYGWVVQAWDESLCRCCGELYDLLWSQDTIPDLGNFVGLSRNDVLKGIYECVLPKSIRHALGECYTPDWLAARAIDSAISASNRPIGELRFLDPTCGSGTFLVELMARYRAALGRVPPGAVVGFDINTLAVLTTKTNYLIAVIDQFSDTDRILLPVYQCDVINVPCWENGSLVVDTNCDFAAVLSSRQVTHLRTLGQSATSAQLVDLIFPENPLISEEPGAFYRQILSHIVADRVFAFFADKADVIVGNPPWVNWEYLPTDYRNQSQHLWLEYGLLAATGRGLRFSKEDISSLITYLVIDRFLQDGGYLSFVLRQGMFKSAQNGAGFRRFRVRENGYGIRVLRVDDLSGIKPFAGMNGKSALVLMKKNEPHTFPVPYCYWSGRKSFAATVRDPRATLSAILAAVDVIPMVAMPAVKDDSTSVWVTFVADAAPAIAALLGSNPYQARTGVFSGGANGVYWVDIVGRNADGTVTISNRVRRAKRQVEAVTAALEPTFLHPLVMGGDLFRWRVTPRSYILCPHTAETKRYPVSEALLRKQAPKTLAYLQSFRGALDERKGFSGWEKSIQQQFFHAVLRVGAYTFATYKVAWRYIAKTFVCAVMTAVDDPFLGHSLPLPNEKVMYVSTEGEGEAYYLCGVLSSAPMACCVQSYMNPLSISAHVLEKLNIPAYAPHNPLHAQISALCKQGHQTASHLRLKRLQGEIDAIVGELYGLDNAQMQAIAKNDAGQKSTL